MAGHDVDLPQPGWLTGFAQGGVGGRLGRREMEDSPHADATGAPPLNPAVGHVQWDI